MNITKSHISIITIIFLSFAFSIYYYPQLPEEMASHWNARGEVDGYMSKQVCAFLMPCIIAGVFLLFLLIIQIDPLKANIKKFKNYYYGFIIAMCLFLFGIHWWMMLWNIGVKVSVNRVMPAAIGALYFFIGYIMKNFKRNWFMGIRTPWTLSNEIVWKRTHEVSGKLFMVSSVIAMCGVFFPKYSFLLVLVPVLATAVFAIVYSYVVYKKVTVAQLDGTAEEMKIESSGDTTWDNLKEGYLYQVERSLLKVKHPAKKEILEDVSSHLDQKYAELDEDNKTWESYQQIITEMGPAEDYAELLETETPKSNKKPMLLLIVTVVAVVAIATIFTPYLIVKYTEIVADRIEDNIDFPFKDDPEVIGTWKSVDFVDSIGDFVPGQKRWGYNLFLHSLTFKEGGSLVARNTKVPNGYPRKWTMGVVISSHQKTSAKYYIQEIGGEKYMFYEWKSGDYTIRHRKPSYYVLKKEAIRTDIAVEEIRIIRFKDGDGLFKDGLFRILFTIVNNGNKRCGMFYARTRRLGHHLNLLTRAGPIEPGEMWRTSTEDFKLPDGEYELTIELDPANQIEELKKDNNSKTLKVIVKDGEITEQSTDFEKVRVSRPSTEESVGSAYTWLELIDNGRYGKSWQEAASFFKANVSREQWENALEAIYKPLGKVINREVISQMPTETIPGGPDGDYVVIQFRTDFENKKGAIETVTPMLEKSGQWRVSGYFIK